MRDVIARATSATTTRQLGVDLSRFTSEQMLMLAQYNLFPNATVLVWGDMLNVLLGLPGPHARSVRARDLHLLPRALRRRAAHAAAST